VGILQEALVLLDLVFVQRVDFLETTKLAIFSLVAKELRFLCERLFLLLGVFLAFAGGYALVDLTFALALELMLGLLSDV